MIYTETQVANLKTQHFAFLEVNETDNVLTITLNRPTKRNAFHPPMVNELAYALAYAHHQKDIWVVLLKANGPVFCAGADLKAFSGIPADPEGSTIPAPEGLIVLGDEFKGLHKPCIAQVGGNLYAGGFLMIGGCTHVVASEDAKFALPEVNRGIWPMQVMASLMPLMNAREMLDLCMRGKTLSAKEAKACGIVSDVVSQEELEAFVSNIVQDILGQSPSAIRYGLQAFHELEGIAKEEEHKYLHGMLMKVIQTKDAREGLAAFREKRIPNWTGE
ncbi:MAG: enoyl-CoA hydratase [Bacteroidetes bacterium]|nr:enoyl-CoA hydratase [Bacteroidota bacterium]